MAARGPGHRRCAGTRADAAGELVEDGVGITADSANCATLVTGYHVGPPRHLSITSTHGILVTTEDGKRGGKMPSRRLQEAPVAPAFDTLGCRHLIPGDAVALDRPRDNRGRVARGQRSQDRCPERRLDAQVERTGADGRRRAGGEDGPRLLKLFLDSVAAANRLTAGLAVLAGASPGSAPETGSSTGAGSPSGSGVPASGGAVAAGVSAGSGSSGTGFGSGLSKLPAIHPVSETPCTSYQMVESLVVGPCRTSNGSPMATLAATSKSLPGPARRLTPSAFVSTRIPGYHCGGGGSGSSRPLITRRASVRTVSSWT